MAAWRGANQRSHGYVDMAVNKTSAGAVRMEINEGDLDDGIDDNYSDSTFDDSESDEYEEPIHYAPSMTDSPALHDNMHRQNGPHMINGNAASRQHRMGDDVRNQAATTTDETNARGEESADRLSQRNVPQAPRISQDSNDGDVRRKQKPPVTKKKLPDIPVKPQCKKTLQQPAEAHIAPGDRGRQACQWPDVVPFRHANQNEVQSGNRRGYRGNCAQVTNQRQHPLQLPFDALSVSQSQEKDNDRHLVSPSRPTHHPSPDVSSPFRSPPSHAKGEHRWVRTDSVPPFPAPPPPSLSPAAKKQHKKGKQNSHGLETPVDNSVSALTQYSWFASSLNREGAEKKVRSYGKNGAFVIRPSEHADEQNPYSLTLLRKREVYHMRVRYRLQDKKFAIGTPKEHEPVFNKVSHLVKFYTVNPIELALPGERDGSVLLTYCADSK